MLAATGATPRQLKVCLIRPPVTVVPSSATRYAVPPLGLAYVAAAVAGAGHACQVIDAIGEAIHQYSKSPISPDSLLHGLKFCELVGRIAPDTEVIGLSLMFSRDWLTAKMLMEHIRERFPAALIVMGGEHISACWKYSLDTCATLDVGVLGEGEATIVSLLQAHSFGAPLASVAGIAYRENGEAKKTAPRPRLQELDAIAPPAWEKFPLEEYISNAFNLGFNLGRSAPLLASRGCPFQCTFCSNPVMWSPKWAVRSPYAVVEEMKRYKKEYRVTNFDFYDLTAIIKKEWIVEFCRILLAEGLDVTWQLPTGTRSESLDEETLFWLYRAGCRSVIYAPESGSAAELKRIKKKIMVPRMLASMRAAHRQGLRTKANIIFGLPGATWGDALRTYLFLVRMAWVGVNDVGCFSFSPYPGSELHDQLVKAGKVTLDENYFRRLNGFNNFFDRVSYSAKFPSYLVSILNIGGMALFYGSSLLFRPGRILRFVNILFLRDTSSALATSLSSAKRKKMALRLIRSGKTDSIQLPPLFGAGEATN